jgi:Na+/H+-dicarboxylate symporter
VKKANNLTLYIIIAMVAGVLLGYTVHTQSSPEFIAVFAERIKILTKIFLLLVQMIIAPLVFSTLVVGIAKLGDLKTYTINYIKWNIMAKQLRIFLLLAY